MNESCHTGVKCNCIAVNVRPPATQVEIETLVEAYYRFIELVKQEQQNPDVEAEFHCYLYPFSMPGFEAVFRKIPTK